jgi:hypothetical protein
VSELDAAIADLERAAERLRSEEIEPDEAAELVERCAELAAALGAALERQAAGPSAEREGTEEPL